MTYRTFDGTSQSETIVDGRFSSSGDIALADGTVTQGAIYFADDKNTGIYSPSNDSIAFTTAGSAALTIASNNAATFAGDVTFSGDSSKDTIWDKSGGQLRLKDNTKLEFGTDSDTQIWHDDAELSIYNGTGTIRTRSDSLLVKNKANSASLLECYSDRIEFPSNIRMASGKGIYFNNEIDDQHFLHDYEEGNFTATCANGVDLYAANDRLNYVKIGRHVTITGQIRIENDNGGSKLVIDNIPFTCNSESGTAEGTSKSCGDCSVSAHAVPANTMGVHVVSNPGNDTLTFRTDFSNDTHSNGLDAHADGYIQFTITYFTAS